MGSAPDEICILNAITVGTIPTISRFIGDKQQGSRRKQEPQQHYAIQHRGLLALSGIRVFPVSQRHVQCAMASAVYWPPPPQSSWQMNRRECVGIKGRWQARGCEAHQVSSRRLA